MRLNSGVTEDCWKSNGLTGYRMKKYCVEWIWKTCPCTTALRNRSCLMLVTSWEDLLGKLHYRFSKVRWMLRMHKEDQDGYGLTTSKVGCASILMNRSRTLLKTDINGEPVSGQHVNLLHQKTTADDDDHHDHGENGSRPRGLCIREIDIKSQILVT